MYRVFNTFAVALGALLAVAFMSPPAAQAAFLFCDASSGAVPGCTETTVSSGFSFSGTLVDSIEFLGLIYTETDGSGKPTILMGNPAQSDIADFKVFVGEIPSTSLAIDRGKIEMSGGSTSGFIHSTTETDALGKTGTFTYNGIIALAMWNITLKADALPAPVYKVNNIQQGAVLTYSGFDNALSNAQFTEVIPIPGTVWLLFSALGVLGLAARRRAAA